MIVIVQKQQMSPTVLQEGDSFVLSYQPYGGEKVAIARATVTQPAVYNCVIAFCFADETGECQSPALCGAFVDTFNLPEELLRATFLDELPEEARERFVRTAPIGG